MTIPCWEVDSDGYIIEHYRLTEEEIETAREEGRHIIEFPWGDSTLVKPKFDFVNNVWIEGETPENVAALSQAFSDELEIEELKNYLAETDFYYIRQMETGKAVPSDIMQKRIDARNRLNQLGL